jgi:competence protein ComEA
MTPAERKALLFLAGIGLLGGAARNVLSPVHAPTRDEREALSTQLQAVDSARAATAAKKHAAPAPDGARRRRRRAAAGAAAAIPRSRDDAVMVVPEAAPLPVGPVDVDVADATTLEGLPGIGPALAQRIVAERAAQGPFGSVQGLERVRGVGPKLAARLAPHVTFSGVARLAAPAVPPRRRRAPGP